MGSIKEASWHTEAPGLPNSRAPPIPEPQGTGGISRITGTWRELTAMEWKLPGRIYGP